MVSPVAMRASDTHLPPPLDEDRVRADFPALRQQVHGRDLVYLDSAATMLKPRAVLDAVVGVYEQGCANVHRGVHLLAQQATAAYEESRAKVRRFIGAAHDREVVFVRGTTEAINLVAHSYGRSRLGPGDEVLITELEHHSNIVPWQLLCQAVGARLRVVPIDDDGAVDLDRFAAKLSERTRIVAIAHVSNALGTVLPVAEICRLARAREIPVLVDGAQAVGHFPVDVQALGCDFYAFSGHKMAGPTGVGVLWGRAELLSKMPPYQGGGEMIRSVTFEKTTYAEIPARFEAGTPNIAGVIGLGAAADYLRAVGLEAIAAHDALLVAYATRRLEELPGLRLIGKAPRRSAVVSFVLEGAHPHDVLESVHPHDVGTIADREGVAIRTGHHCAQPVMERFGVPATSRASFGLYNTRADIDRLVAAVHRAREVFA